jgi:hypothetical protein
MGRVSVQVSPKTISLNGDVPGSTVPGAFEHGVLNKMADSV